MKRFLCVFVFLRIIISPNFAFSQISGRVFEETSSTVQKSSAISGKGISNIPIKAYGKSQSGKYELITQTQTDTKGSYFLSIEEGKDVKLVFGDGSRNLQSSCMSPSVRFVKSPASDVSWTISQPSRYVSSNSFLVAPVYTNGKGIDTLSALLALPLGDTLSVSLASSKQVGALWAVAYNKWTKQLYSSALAKRHMGYGPLGTGGIYRTDWKTRATVSWLDLKQLGIPTGDDHHEDLKSAVDSSSIDAKLMSDVGKLSLGGMDVSEDGSILYVMNLYNRTLYGIKLPVDSISKPTVADVTAYTMPPSVCTGGISRPFAVKVHEGSVYIGIVCDAQNSQLLTDLTATVYKLDVVGKRFTSVFTMPMDYKRGKAVIGMDVQSWYPWTDDFSKALHLDYPSTATRPQPILSSIAFDATGAMVLGFMDRFGHQSGTGQPEPGGKASYSGVAAGDVLRVYPRKPGNFNPKFSLENNAIAGLLSSEGKGNLQGPMGGEFFFQDGFTFSDAKRNARSVHEETGAGGLVILPGTEEVLMTAHEPTDTFNSGGIKSFFSEDGKTNRGWLLYNDGQKGTFGKANGVGGLAIISDLPDIAAGNRIWTDTNGDGIQDPDEAPIANITVELLQKDTKLATTLSDIEGTYLFNKDNVKGGLKPGTDYQVRIKLEKQVLKPTISKGTTDIEVDNDGIAANGYVAAAFKTGKPGEHIHSLDFGFLPLLKPEITDTDKENGLIVYPNPVIKDLELEMRASAKSAVVRLLDLTGRELLTKELSSIEGKYKSTLDVSDLPTGNYVLSIEENSGKRTTTKILKVKQ